MKRPISTFAKAYNDLTSAIVRAKRACRKSAKEKKDGENSSTKMPMTKIKKTSQGTQGRAGRPKGSKDKKPRCNKQASKLVSRHDDASDCEESTGPSSKSLMLAGGNISSGCSTSNNLESVDSTNVCSGHDDESSLKVSEAFEDEREMAFQGLEMGRQGTRNIPSQQTTEMPACWEFPLPC